MSCWNQLFVSKINCLYKSRKHIGTTAIWSFPVSREVPWPLRLGTSLDVMFRSGLTVQPLWAQRHLWSEKRPLKDHYQLQRGLGFQLLVFQGLEHDVCKQICRYPLYWFHQATAGAEPCQPSAVPCVDPWEPVVLSGDNTHINAMSHHFRIKNSAAGDPTFDRIYHSDLGMLQNGVPKLIEKHATLLVTRAQWLLLNFHSFGYASVHLVLVVNI